MIVRGILLDLDGTLVNTSALDALRDQKQWKRCVENLHQTTVFSGISEMLQTARHKGVGIGVVTSSVSYYAAAVLQYHGLPYDILVAYHDTSRRKPSPDPYITGAKKLGFSTDTIVGIGDSAEDALSLQAANIRAYGAGWSGSIQQHQFWYRILKEPSEVPL